MGAGDIQAVVFWTGGGGQGFAYNVLHLKLLTGSVDQALCDQIGGVLGDAFIFGTPGWRDAVSDQVSMTHVTIKELTDPPGPEFLAHIDEVGRANGDLLPPEISLVTSLRTSHAGRRGRGRIYNWGFSTACNDALGQADPSCTSIINSGWEKVRTDLNTDGNAALAVYSRLDDATYVVDSVATDIKWDEQRRRRR